MKIINSILFFFLSLSSYANDISKYEIEGMSIGDSLLEFYKISEINNAPNYNDLPSNMEFTIIEMPKRGKFEMLQFMYKTDDRDYLIASVGGAIFMDGDQCEIEKGKTAEDIASVIQNAKIIEGDTFAHPDDSSGKSYVSQNYIELNDGFASVECYAFSSNVQWQDHMRITILNNEANDWILSNYGLDQ